MPTPQTSFPFPMSTVSRGPLVSCSIGHRNQEKHRSAPNQNPIFSSLCRIGWRDGLQRERNLKSCSTTSESTFTTRAFRADVQLSVDTMGFYDDHCFYLPPVRWWCSDWVGWDELSWAPYCQIHSSTATDDWFAELYSKLHFLFLQMLGWFVFSAMLSSYNKVRQKIQYRISSRYSIDSQSPALFSFLDSLSLVRSICPFRVHYF